MKSFRLLLIALATTAFASAPAYADTPSERQSLEELRNTVVNLLQALVDQGVMTREKAQALVKQAQDKAAADSAASAAADAGAVRVPYVPEVVKEQIRKEVQQDLEPGVVDKVVARAKAEGWGVPAALPDWLDRIKVGGQVTFRAQGDFYPNDNVTGVYYNFQAINSAGSILGAGVNAVEDVNSDRDRLRVRGRIGVEAAISPSLTAGLRLATGNPSDPSSEFQTLGNYGQRYAIQMDQAYLRWDDRTVNGFDFATVAGGRMPSPWFSPTNLVYYQELQFEGLAGTARLGFGDGSANQSHAFLTLGAMPMQEYAFASRDKWMFGAQLGTLVRIDDQQLRIAAALYDFKNVQGLPNQATSPHQYDFTAPPWLQQGNSVYNIAYNPAGSTSALYALASRFKVANISLSYDVPIGAYSLGFKGDAVQNLGFDQQQIYALTGQQIAKRNKGYQGDVSFGSPVVDAFGRWRAVIGYRYLQRDAVLDAWTDTDFHEGGTDAKGYYLIGDFGLTTRTFFRVRYLSANEIDGPTGMTGLGQLRYGVDVLQLDVSTTF
jgi:Putative porin